MHEHPRVPIEVTAHAVLDEVEGKVHGTGYINELLALVDTIAQFEAV